MDKINDLNNGGISDGLIEEIKKPIRVNKAGTSESLFNFKKGNNDNLLKEIHENPDVINHKNNKGESILEASYEEAVIGYQSIKDYIEENGSLNFEDGKLDSAIKSMGSFHKIYNLNIANNKDSTLSIIENKKKGIKSLYMETLNLKNNVEIKIQENIKNQSDELASNLGLNQSQKESVQGILLKTFVDTKDSILDNAFSGKTSMSDEISKLNKTNEELIENLINGFDDKSKQLKEMSKADVKRHLHSSFGHFKKLLYLMFVEMTEQMINMAKPH